MLTNQPWQIFWTRVSNLLELRFRVGEEGATIENQVDLDASELLAAVGGQVDGGLGPEDGGVAPVSMLLLDQDQMMKLESVLQSDEAKNILGDINEVSAAGE